MTISEHLQAPLWDNGLISLPRDLPVSRSLLPGSDEAQAMTVGSGRRFFGLLTNAGPAGACLRTLLGSSRWGSTIVCLRWKASITKRGRLYFRLVPSARGTVGTASGLLPAPQAHNAKGAPGKGHLESGGRRSDLGVTVNSLTKDNLLTTPTAGDTSHRTGKYQQGGTALSSQMGGSLNPEFVEWMQGYPIGWTEV